VFSLFARKKPPKGPGLQGRRKLYLPENLYRRMINHCYEERPLEACGLFGGAAGHAELGFACDNAHRSPRIYQIDDQQMVAAWRQIQQAQQEIIAIYHSHVETDPVPSRTDIAQATFPEAFYVIVSLKGRRPRVQAWLIVDGQVTEHQVVIVRHVNGAWHDLRQAVRSRTEPGSRPDMGQV